MTIIELFPWVLALSFAWLGAVVGKGFGIPDAWIPNLAIASGICTRVACLFWGGHLLSWLSQKEMAKRERTMLARYVDKSGSKTSEEASSEA